MRRTRHNVIDTQRSGPFIQLGQHACNYATISNSHAQNPTRSSPSYTNVALLNKSQIRTMPSSKGTPTDPELREQLKEGSSCSLAISNFSPEYCHGSITDNFALPQRSNRRRTRTAAARASGRHGRYVSCARYLERTKGSASS
jgi:hypothetical protein